MIQVVAAAVPLTAGLLGNASLPGALWALVVAGALVAWMLAERIARSVWRHHAESEPAA